MVNNWQCFKRFSVSGGLQKKEKPGDVFSCSRQGLRFQFMFCLSSSSFFFFSFFDSQLVWSEKKKSPFLSRPIWYSPNGAPSFTPLLVLHPPRFTLNPLWRSRVTCYSLLCLAWAPQSRRQGQDFTGVAFRTASYPQHRPREVWRRAKKSRERRLVTSVTSFSTRRSGCWDSRL